MVATIVVNKARWDSNARNDNNDRNSGIGGNQNETDVTNGNGSKTMARLDVQ